MPTCALTSRRIAAPECYAHVLGASSGADLAACREQCAHGRELMATVPFFRAEGFPALRAAPAVPAPSVSMRPFPAWLLERAVSIPATASTGLATVRPTAASPVEAVAGRGKKSRRSKRGAASAPAPAVVSKVVQHRPRTKREAGKTAVHLSPPPSVHAPSRPPAWLAAVLAYLIPRYPAADLHGLRFFRMVARNHGFGGDLAECRAVCESCGLTVSGKARPYVKIDARAREIARMGEAI